MPISQKDKITQELALHLHTVLNYSFNHSAVTFLSVWSWRREWMSQRDALGPDGRSGYQHVTALAHAIGELCHHTYVTQLKAREIVALWEKLLDHDKAPDAFPPRRLVTGRFKSSRSSSIAGVDSVQRSFLGKGAGAAQSPKVSRLVEAIFLKLCDVHSEGRSLGGVQDSRCASVLRDYNTTRDVVVSCPTLMTNTSIHLYNVNQKTLLTWHTMRSKGMMWSDQEQTVWPQQLQGRVLLCHIGGSLCG
ncbi:uncharacterized protein LOC114848508 [Betta splendens]|uniref:Uncharacterized protein LOC114848508 n=1 Tax=Betta splendens TaxID=158456 RepID=A0A6P7LJH0_BETSP|nr:uncharacterized protein LOC114848508 [Betta splendens]